jgi:hypothetical protein
MPRVLTQSLAVLLAILSAIGLGTHYTYRAFPNSDFPQLQRHLRQHLAPGDLIVHESKLSFFPTHDYAADLPQTYLPDPPGSATDTLSPITQRALGLESTPITPTLTAARVWLVTFDRAIDEAQAAGLAHTPAYLTYRAHCDLAGNTHIGDLVLYRFTACRPAQP